MLGDGTQGLVHAKEMLYPPSYTSSPPLEALDWITVTVNILKATGLRTSVTSQGGL